MTPPKDGGRLRGRGGRLLGGLGLGEALQLRRLLSLWIGVVADLLQRRQRSCREGKNVDEIYFATFSLFVQISDSFVVLLLARRLERGRAEAGVSRAALAGSKNAQNGL